MTQIREPNTKEESSGPNQIARRSYHTKCTKKCGLRTIFNAVLKELGPKNLNWIVAPPSSHSSGGSIARTNQCWGLFSRPAHPKISLWIDCRFSANRHAIWCLVSGALCTGTKIHEHESGSGSQISSRPCATTTTTHPLLHPLCAIETKSISHYWPDARGLISAAWGCYEAQMGTSRS
jgi:hypothetical protein